MIVVLRMGMRDPITAIYLATIAACALVLVTRVGLTWLSHHRRRDVLDREPRCASCGYILAVATSPICPECGRDVRQYGLVTARARPRIGLLPLYILLALLALPGAIRCGYLVAHAQPLFGWRYHCEQMVAVGLRRDGSFGPPRYAVQSEGRGLLGRKHPDYVWAYCNTDGSGHPMLMADLKTGQFEVVDATGRKSVAQAVTAASVADFLRQRHPDVLDTPLTSASEKIVAALRAQMSGNLPSEERMLDDPWNGISLHYSVSDGVVLATGFLSWVILGSLLIAGASGASRYRLRRRRKLWHREAERVRLAVTSDVAHQFRAK